MPRALEPGIKAPDFRLPRDGGGTVSLADFAGRKLVLYFYPKADTPGCTKEAIDFSQLKGAFNKTGADVLGSLLTRCRHRTNSRPNMTFPLRSLPTRPTACWRPMAYGGRNRCTAGNSSGLCARPF
jgi:peroxiredoxin Q/BCP